MQYDNYLFCYFHSMKIIWFELIEYFLTLVIWYQLSDLLTYIYQSCIVLVFLFPSTLLPVHM